jgi:hypothetical protein
MADRVVIQVKNGGYSHGGHTVIFDFSFQDGSVEQFRCPADAYGKLVSELRSLGQLAEQVRRTAPGQTMEVIRPYLATNSRTAVASGGEIMVRFSTPEGIPVDIAMPQTLARETVERLQIALEQAQNASGPTN